MRYYLRDFHFGEGGESIGVKIFHLGLSMFSWHPKPDLILEKCIKNPRRTLLKV